MKIRHVLAVGALLALLAGCADDSGGNPPGGNPGGGGNGGGGAPDPCTLLPDAAIEAALGAPPGDRMPYAAGESCSIESTAVPPGVLQVTIGGNGREGFEIHRGYVQDIENLYQPLSGIGDDAFAFGHEVTVLKGDYSVTLFIEGLPFDDVPEEQILERAKTLAGVAAAQLG